MSRCQGSIRGPARALALALLPVLLVACGKRNAPEVPEGREREFTYPLTYPAPALVVPGGPVEYDIAQPARPSGSFRTRSDRNRTRVFGPVSNDPLFGLPTSNTEDETGANNVNSITGQ